MYFILLWYHMFIIKIYIHNLMSKNIFGVVVCEPRPPDFSLVIQPRGHNNDIHTRQLPHTYARVLVMFILMGCLINF